MSVQHFGVTDIVWGVPATIPELRNVPPGKHRLRFRNRACGEIFVRPPEGGIRRYLLKMCDGYIEPVIELGRNQIITK